MALRVLLISLICITMAGAEDIDTTAPAYWLGVCDGMRAGNKLVTGIRRADGAVVICNGAPKHFEVVN